MARLLKVKDTLTPELRRKAAAVKNKRPLLTAMGTRVKDLGKQAFSDAALRPARWAARKDDQPHPLLRKSRDLMNSLTITGYGAASVTVGSNKGYAATHQLGSKKRNIPARPYFPFKGKKLTAAGDKAVSRAIRSYLKARGIS